LNSAPIYSIAAEDRARAESAAWGRFSAPRDSADFCSGWLAVVCGQIERVNAALLLLKAEQDGAFAVAAVWPDPSRNMQYLSAAAQKALTERRGVVLAADGVSPPVRDQPAFVGYPVEVSGDLCGVVVLDLARGTDHELQRALRLLHWGSAWLIDQFRLQALEDRDGRLGRLSLATEVMATALQERRFAAAALAVANELAARLACDRVSIGFERSGSIEVQVISHTATFDRRTDMVRLIGEAMDEVLDLDVALVHPVPGDDIAAPAHGELARALGVAAVCSVPLKLDGRTIGVLTLERGAGTAFDEASVELCRTVGLLLGPVLELKRDSERNLIARAGTAAAGWARVLFGPRHPGAKLIALVVAATLAYLSVAQGEFRVAARTAVEGAVQRAAVAPYDGYLAQSLVRAGDTVKAGQVLARLEDKDLRLEQTRWQSEREQLDRKYRQALAARDRAAVAVTAAQVSQAEAQLALVEERLARATLVAPFDGVVVSGDLSQLLGTPVEQGKVLFEIAPLDAYRVILKVDERDITHLRLGQRGELTLPAIPGEAVPFTVKQITSVATVQDERNFFRVEAQIEGPSERLRPGMEGVGKVSIDERRLIWIWTHSLLDWLRVSLWAWLP
jgi:RND family efflux transporter MFP subunit